MRRVKIFGAGSIGNHLAQASRTLGWSVVVCDVDPRALDRMKRDIYPGRYGRWDEEIALHTVDAAPRGGFDLICVGTPPDSHLPLALQAIDETPRAVLIEKPACPPSLEQAQELVDRARRNNTQVYVGYDHVVGKAARRVEELVKANVVGEIRTLDVEFREHWEGIFKAHPWLSGPSDSYLGFWKRGGGASGEHSHALNLWQHFAHLLGAGRVIETDCLLTYQRDGAAEYDSLCSWNLRTEGGLCGRVVQDVVTRPSRKRAVLQGTDGAIEWINGHSPQGDAVIIHRPGQAPETEIVPKKRPDDFLQELSHVGERFDSGAESPIGVERGLATAVLVAAAHKSEAERRRIAIDWKRGFTLEALT
jgi:predicted dehydrogenase